MALVGIIASYLFVGYVWYVAGYWDGVRGQYRADKAKSNDRWPFLGDDADGPIDAFAFGKFMWKYATWPITKRMSK